MINDVKNYIKARKWGLVVFTDPTIINDEINLEDKKSVYIYLGSSSGEIENYTIDYDLNYDCKKINLAPSYFGVSNNKLTSISTKIGNTEAETITGIISAIENNLNEIS